MCVFFFFPFLVGGLYKSTFLGGIDVVQRRGEGGIVLDTFLVKRSLTTCSWWVGWTFTVYYYTYFDTYL